MCPCTMKNALSLRPFWFLHSRGVAACAQSPSVAPLALHAGPPGTTVYAELGTVVHVLMCM